jgi:enoyl-[acyl-carrier-protein] reductase (NADH)
MGLLSGKTALIFGVANDHSIAWGIAQAFAREGARLRRHVTIEDVGNTAVFLCSDLADAITGEIVYVDAGFNILGVAAPEDVA